jgi:hypothetical protein
MDFLSYFALAMLIFVILVLSYGIIAIHDIPYHIAKARNHPHQDAIHSGGWVSLFTLHAIWPFLWLWATAYHPEGGYAGRPKLTSKNTDLKTPQSLENIQDRIVALKKELAELEAAQEKSKTTPSE